jgi:hypothetical protein
MILYDMLEWGAMMMVKVMMVKVMMPCDGDRRQL